MSGPPLPQPYDEDHLDGISAWHEVLYWAQHGDERPLLEMLRGDTPIASDDRDVREFLADRLAGEIKRRRGKPMRRPQGTWWMGPNGLEWIDERDKQRYQIARWIREHKAEHGKRVFEAAAVQFGIEEQSLVDMMRRSLKAIKKKRST